MTGTRFGFLSVCCLGLLATTDAARATEATLGTMRSASVAALPDSPMHRADRSFANGLWLYADGDLQGALAQFRAAHAAFPNFRVLYNIAGLLRELGDWAGAMRTYRKYLVTGGDLVPPERRLQVEGVLAELGGKVGRIQVEADGGPSGITIDEESFTVTSPEQSVEVNPGRHRVRISNAHIPTQTRSLDIASGERLRLIFDTVPIPVPVIQRPVTMAPRPAPVPPPRIDPR
jgi:hypothetical protein